MHRKPLDRYKYPVVIVIFMLFIAVCVAYSVTLLTKYVVAARNLQLGIKAYKEQDYQRSITLIESTLQSVPASKEAKIAIAKAYFKMHTKSFDQKALYYLHCIEIDKYDLPEIISVMPDEYRQDFVLSNTKKDK